MNLTNKHPLDIWQSPEVTEFLADFFAENYMLTGIKPEVAKDYVWHAFKSKNSTDYNVLREQCAKMLLGIQKQMEKIKYRESDPLEIINLEHVKTFLDVGANRLSAINYLGKKHKNIKKFIGVDVIPQSNNFSYPQKSQYIQVDPNKPYPLPENSVDAILAQYVFHHFKNESEIKQALNNCLKILKPDGQFILMEESFTKSYNFDDIKTNHEKFNIHTNEDFTKRFYNLSEDKKWEFIIANDWLIGVNNKHMQWTGQYRVWEDWEELLKHQGFKLAKSYSLGLRVNGRLKQGVHIIGIFSKT